MATKDWLVPLVVGGLGFAGLYALPGPAHLADEADGPAFEFPFRDIAVSGTTPDGYRVLATLHPAITAPDECPVAHGSGMKGNLHLDGVQVQATCLGPGLAALPLGEWTAVAVGDWPSGPGADAVAEVVEVRQAPPGPRLGLAGYNGTRVTVHVFDGAGELIASNGNASEQARLVRTYSAEQLPTGVWYLGAAPAAPPGTQPLPFAARALLPQLRPLLEGLPVGGVATTQTDALAGLYGRLYVTAQVDELVHAP